MPHLVLDEPTTLKRRLRLVPDEPQAKRKLRLVPDGPHTKTGPQLVLDEPNLTGPVDALLPGDPSAPTKLTIPQMTVEQKSPLQFDPEIVKQLWPKNEAGLELQATPEPRLWEKVERFFAGEPDAGRWSKPGRAEKLHQAVNAPMNVGAKFVLGRLLKVPDVAWAVIKKIVPEDTLTDEVRAMNIEDAMEWAAGYNPSGFARTIGGLAEFAGGLKTAESIGQTTGLLTAKQNLPKGIGALGKAGETAKLFGVRAAATETSKLIAQMVDPDADYDYGGAETILTDVVAGAVLSMAHTGAKTIWNKLKPTEQTQALKVLGLKKGASLEDINKASRREALKFHPDKVAGQEKRFIKVIKARDLLRRSERGDIVTGKTRPATPKLLGTGPARRQRYTGQQGKDANRQKVRQETALAEELAKLDAEYAAVVRSSPPGGQKAAAVAHKAAKAVKTAPVASVGKKPWEMTREEYKKELAKTSIRPQSEQSRAGITDAASRKSEPERKITKFVTESQQKKIKKLEDKLFKLRRRIEPLQEKVYEGRCRIKESFKGKPDAKKLAKKAIYHTEKSSIEKKQLDEIREKFRSLKTEIENLKYGTIWEQIKEREQRKEAHQANIKADTRLKDNGHLSSGYLNELDKWAEQNSLEIREYTSAGGTSQYITIFRINEDRTRSELLKIRLSDHISGQLSASVFRRPDIDIDTANVDIDIMEEFENDLKDSLKDDLEDLHSLLVRQALYENKPVPLEVLEKYKGEKWADEAIVKSADEIAKQTLRGKITRAKTKVSRAALQKRLDKLEGTPAAKLPQVGKTTAKKPVRVYSGIDPGVDKFIAEDIVPAARKAKEAAAHLTKIGKAAPKLFMDVFEPAKAAEKVAGKRAYAAVIKAIHTPEARELEFERQRLDTMDTNVEQLKQWMNQFEKTEQRDFLTAFAGRPGSVEAQLIQDDAFKKLPKELREPQVVRAIREISDNNYRLLRKVAGRNIKYVQDYFYGIYKSSTEVDRFIKEWKTTDRFIKHKHLPSMADAINYGLKPRFDNYLDNLQAEFRAIARLGAFKDLKKQLMAMGKGTIIDGFGDAPVGWEAVHDPVFADVLVKPEMAKLLNNLISTNKITRHTVGKFFTGLNNFLRIIKFAGSAFHLRVIAKQAIADSGYLGFLHKKTAWRGMTAATQKQLKKLRAQPEYKRLLELGLGKGYSHEEQAQKSFKNFVDKLNRGNYLGAVAKAGGMVLKIPSGFTNWMFEQYIPMVKTTKIMDAWAEFEAKKGRNIEDWELIEIIKETQNFYGMMNERLFGRSGSVTTGLRFIFLAPGFAEGNYRTILKSLLQWGVGEGWSASRSRSNILNSMIVTGIIATVGTMKATRKPPKKPETMEDIRDLFKIDTGKVDGRGKRVMIDVMDYDKDYFNIYYNTLRGRPDKAVYESIRRLGGMKAPIFEMMTDLTQIAQGRALYDWRGNRVTEITDPWLQKLMKIAVHEIRKTEPISVSVFKQARRKDVNLIIALVESASGVRATISEKDKRERDILRRCWSLKGQGQEVYESLATIRKPRAAVAWYNNKIQDVLNSPLVPKKMRDEWTAELIIDLERFLQNKAHAASLDVKRPEGIKKTQKAVAVLKNFGVTPDEAKKLLQAYYGREKTRTPVSPLERDRVIGRARKRRRLMERME